MSIEAITPAASAPEASAPETPALELDYPPYWSPPPDSADLIFDDGEPLESNRHRIAINALIDAAMTALEGKTDCFVGGNMFVYYSRDQVKNQDFKGPDFFVVLDADGSRERQGWVVWEEGGRYPDMIIELLSPSTVKVDLGKKKALYEGTFRTREYYVYDPFDPAALQGWRLNGGQRYAEIAPNAQSRLWCETLKVWLGTWEGQVKREPGTGTCGWLRFYDRQGNLIPLQEELAEQERQRAEQESQRAEQEKLRADRLAARLRELGEDPEAV